MGKVSKNKQGPLAARTIAKLVNFNIVTLPHTALASQGLKITSPAFFDRSTMEKLETSGSIPTVTQSGKQSATDGSDA